MKYRSTSEQKVVSPNVYRSKASWNFNIDLQFNRTPHLSIVPHCRRSSRFQALICITQEIIMSFGKSFIQDAAVWHFSTFCAEFIYKIVVAVRCDDDCCYYCTKGRLKRKLNWKYWKNTHRRNGRKKTHTRNCLWKSFAIWFGCVCHSSAGVVCAFYVVWHYFSSRQCVRRCYFKYIQHRSQLSKMTTRTSKESRYTETWCTISQTSNNMKQVIYLQNTFSIPSPAHTHCWSANGILMESKNVLTFTNKWTYSTRNASNFRFLW